MIKEETMDKFRKHIKEFTEYWCTCCNRMVHRKSVVKVTVNICIYLYNLLQRICLSGNSWQRTKNSSANHAKDILREIGKKGSKDQEKIQSNTTPDPGYHSFLLNVW